jgi:uncharacterized protein
MALKIGRKEARQLAVRAQLLDANRPTDLVNLVDRLTLLQIDPTAAIAPNADLVAWSRLGAAYQPADLTRALEERTLFELRAFVRPMSAVALHVPEETGYTADASVRGWLDANDGFRRDVIARLRDAGPLLSRDVPDTCQVPWGSTGWTNNRNVTQMLELLSARGEVAVAGRVGRQRLWDVADRVYPSFEALPADEAQRRREQRRLRSLGLARAKTPRLPGEPIEVGEAGVPITLEGLDGQWRAKSRRARPTLYRSHGFAVTVRPSNPRPPAYEESLRLRLHPGDVQAGSESALGLLRLARASPRPPRRQAGRQGRPQGENIHHQRPA